MGNFTPGARGPNYGGGWYGVTILRNVTVDECPHRHRSRKAAIRCAEVMCCVRNGQEKASPPVTSDCFRHGTFDAMFCPTCEREAGR